MDASGYRLVSGVLLKDGSYEECYLSDEGLVWYFTTPPEGSPSPLEESED